MDNIFNIIRYERDRERAKIRKREFLIWNIRMSPQHAKMLSEELIKSVAEYEKKIGKIPLP